MKADVVPETASTEEAPKPFTIVRPVKLVSAGMEFALQGEMGGTITIAFQRIAGKHDDIEELAEQMFGEAVTDPGLVVFAPTLFNAFVDAVVAFRDELLRAE